MSDVGYSGVANLAPTTLGYARDVQGSNYRQLSGMGDSGVAMSPDFIPSALTLLNRLTYSPAGIFTAGQGYLQTPGNLLTNSNPTWTVVKGATGVGTVTTGQTDPYGGSTAQRIQLTQNTDFALVQTAMPSTTGVHTGMMMVRSNTGVSQTIKIWTDNVAAVDVTATTDWAIVAATQNVTANTFFKILSTSTCDVTVARIGVAVGTYTASQLAAMGGIPLTTAAAVPAVYTDAHVYQAGSTQTVYGAELASSAYFAPSGYDGVIVPTSGGFTTTKGTAGQTRVALAINTAAGKTYTITWASLAGSSLAIFARDGAIASGTVLATANPAAGPASLDFVAASTSSSILWSLNPPGGYSVSDVSVREKITQSSVINSLLSNNYILSGGSTGYSAVDGPVGLVLDGMGSVGSELASTSSITLTGTNAYTALTMTSVSVGKTYRVSYDYNLSSGNLQFGAASSFTVGPAHSGPSSGTYTYFATGVGTNNLQIAYSNFAVGSVSNIIIKEVTGIHATQATTANKPTVRRGLLNLQAQSNTIATTWTVNSGGVPTNAAAVGVDGVTSNASTLAVTSTSGSGVYSFITTVSGTTYTQAYLLKVVSGGPTSFKVGTDTISGVLIINPATMTITSPGGAITASSVAAAGNGYYLFACSWAATGVSTSSIIQGTGQACTMAVGGVGCFVGTLTAQQILESGGIPLTTSAAASNATAGRYSWSFDGGDSLALGSVPFQMADDFAVIAAVNASATGTQAFYAQASTATANPLVELGTASGLPRFAFRDDAGTVSTPSGGASIANAPTVVSGRKVGSTKVVRSNGAQLAVDPTALGATTFNSASIGVRPVAAPVNFVSGNASIVIVVKGTLSDADMLTLERFAASTLPNAPSF